MHDYESLQRQQSYVPRPTYLINYNQVRAAQNRERATGDYAILSGYARKTVYWGYPDGGESGTELTSATTGYEKIYDGVLTYDAWQRANLEEVRKKQKGYLDIDQAYDEYLYERWTQSKELGKSYSSSIVSPYQSQLSNLMTSHRNAWAERNRQAEQHAQEMASRRTEMLMLKAQRAIESAKGAAGSSMETATRSGHTDNSLVASEGSGGSLGGSTRAQDTPEGSLY